MDSILKATYEWAYRGAIKDFNTYIILSPQKILGKQNIYISGIFLNKFKTRLIEAFGEKGRSHSDGISTKSFIIKIKENSIIDKCALTLEEIRFTEERVELYEHLKWFLKYTGNHFPIGMSKEFKTGKLSDFIQDTLATPAPETIEERNRTTTLEEWEGRGSDIY